MKDRVNITITGYQREVDESPTVEKAEGRYSFKDGKHYIRYENEGVSNLLVVTDDSISMRRSGRLNSNMLFVKDQKTHTDYVTEQGCLDMEMYTEHIGVERLASSEKAEDTVCLKVDLIYDLEVNGQHLSKSELNILVM